MTNRIIIGLLSLLILSVEVSAKGCYSSLTDDTLRIGNDLVERTFVWNGGDLITHSLTSKFNGQVWINRSKNPDFRIAKGQPKVQNASCRVQEVEQTFIRPPYHEVTVSFTIDSLEVRRVYKVYEGVPVIACDTYLKGAIGDVFGGKSENAADRKNIEFAEDMKSRQANVVLDHLNFGGNHWAMQTVEFYDVTDWNNNLVFATNVIPYRKNPYRGNLLFAHNRELERGFFFLKEAPCSSAQPAYNGYDFTAEFGQFTVTGLGINATDICQEGWTKIYGIVVGLYDGAEVNRLTALRAYQKSIRRLLPGRDEMVMMNTWGDRSQDSKINEKFSLLELERAAQLGMTHFQIDDGWQVGKSPNSALAKGSFKNIWDNPDYWKPDPVKYPRGLFPIVQRANELGVEICLWFNPSVQNSYADWQKDAQAMIDLYKECGIRTFKIDGLAIPTKESEMNLRCLFDRVLFETDHQVVFNLDVTAGRRGGYHMLTEYGNIFLENRYTDWQNYYPYHTLRNLWQLSKYVPTEKLQIEFLNKWRNAAKYKDDPFAPNRYSMEYLFAITMAGQPLAWLEGTGLPDQALVLNKLIEQYKTIQHDLHSGTILPIGEEPSGKAWTGFQSLNKDRGYFLFYRENNSDQRGYVQTWLAEGTMVKCTPLMGEGKPMRRRIGRQGVIEVELPSINSFVVYRYEILK